VQVIFSAFILAAAVGPIFFAPLSEIYGRKIVTLVGNAFYIVWTIVCGFATTKSVMIVGRFLSGLGASVTFGVQYGLLSDCWKAEERGKSLAILNFAPLLGPALGPIFGGFIVQASPYTWRWIFWSIAIFDGALQLLARFLLWETYAPVLLARKARVHRRQTGNTRLHTAFDSPDRSPRQILQTSLIRPLRILTLHPVAQVLTLYGCIGFGTLYIVLSDFAEQWIDRYKQPASSAGLHYLALVIGFTAGSIVGARGMDRMWRRVEAPTPELRIFFLIPGTITLVAGLLVYGWGAEKLVHWIVPDLGVAIFGFGAQVGTTAIGAYLTDAYGLHTASASAGSFAMRSLVAFGFPLFAPQLYLGLGYGLGNMVLAGACAIVGAIVPTLVYKYGPGWRARTPVEL
jgi:multidrug resistance protein